ncbi:hypothetical protein D3C83_143620 [compost metagenome]
MDERFHRLLHLGAARRRVLGFLRHHRAWRLTQQLHALLHDLRRLVHFLDTTEVAIVAIAVLTERNLEIEFAVDFIRLRASQIPGEA